MKKRNKFLTATLLIGAWLSLPFILTAQVAVGADEPPQEFSILEIISNERGMRLPQLSTGERNDLQSTTEFQNEIILKGRGLMIYNTDNNCVEYWNKQKWIALCDGYEEGMCVEISGVTIAGETTYIAEEAISLAAVIAPLNTTATSYQWYKNGAILPGMTGASLGIIDSTVDDTGSYTVKVSNNCTSEVTSPAVAVVVTAP